MKRYFVGVDPASTDGDTSVMTTGFIDEDGTLTITSVQVSRTVWDEFTLDDDGLIIDVTAEVIPDEPKLIDDGEEKHAY